MATFLEHTSCPRCGSRDNLGRYSDGSAWCFGCHLLLRGTDSGDIHHHQDHKTPIGVGDYNVQLSDDLCSDFPGHVVAWLAKYGISVGEAIKHGWKYSPYWDQLVFLFNDGEGNVACSQARNFNPERAAKRKYYNQGSPKDVLPIFGSTTFEGVDGVATRLVVVEDAVSAAKIARQSPSMPCLGSYLPVRKITALKALNYQTILVWLDSDKLKEAREIEAMCKWIGLSSRTIHTELDPKEYSDEEIAQLL